MAWLSGYSKRKPLTLTGGPSGAQTDFQLSIAVSHEAAMQGDFDDIRFTRADGTTLVDAWAEVIITDTSATVWVEFPSTPANTVEQTYYMYYGNGSAVSDWDGVATFLQYHGSATSSFIESVSLQPDVIYEADITPSATNIELHTGLGDTLESWPDNTVNHQIWTNGNIYARSEKNDVATTSSSVAYTTDRRKHKIIWETAQARFYYNNSLFATYTTNIPTVNLGLFAHFTSGSATIHWAFVRKYASGPPTYAFGSEESAPTGVAPTAVFYGPLFGPFRGPI